MERWVTFLIIDNSSSSGLNEHVKNVAKHTSTSSLSLPALLVQPKEEYRPRGAMTKGKARKAKARTFNNLVKLRNKARGHFSA